jgi:hypothetical protein
VIPAHAAGAVGAVDVRRLRFALAAREFPDVVEDIVASGEHESLQWVSPNVLDQFSQAAILIFVVR